MEEKVSPEVQEQFDIFVINGMNIIHNEKMSNSIITKIMKNPDPIKAISEVTVDIVSRLQKSASQNGQNLKQEVLVHGGNILMGEILRLLEAAGMEPLSDEKKTACWQLAVSIFLSRGVKDGSISKQNLLNQANLARQTDQGKQIMDTAKKPEMNQMEEIPNG